MEQYIIATERLGLRRWLGRDRDPFILMNQDKRVMEYYPKTLTVDETIEMIKRIDLHFEKNGFGLFAVEERVTGQFIGYTGFSIPTFKSFFTPCIEIGWRYKFEAWGKGFATEAAKACLNYGFQTLKFESVVSFTAALNARSEKVMIRSGMAKTGFFDHPAIPASNILCRHVLYGISKKDFYK